MSVAPNTIIKLLKVPFTIDNKNQLTFSNVNAQTTYFNSLPFISAQNDEIEDEFQYVRKDKVIRFPANYDEIISYNYVMYKNSNYGDKWFYAFISKMEYINDEMTEITIATDVFQTWQFDIIYHKMFVEREHVNSDVVGEHTVPEDLNFGEIISDWENSTTIIGAESYYWLVVASNYNPSDDTRYAGLGSYGKYPQGSMWFAWLVNINSPASTFNDISDWIYNVTLQGKADSIQSMFTLPYQAFSLSDVNQTTHLVTNGAGNQLNDDLTFSKSTLRNFSDYTPKNKKLLTYPYSFLRITNNLGSFNDYRIEDFKEYDVDGNLTDNLKFNAIGVPCQGYSGKLRPKNYKGILYNEDEAITLGKYPTVSWSSDSFINWLTQNAVNIGINSLSTAINAGVSIGAKGEVGSGLASVAQGIASTIGSEIQATFLPNNAQGNANTGDVAFSQNLIRFKIMHLRPKKEYLIILDDYFNNYGYKVNSLKIPNVTGRRNWNYVKTIGCNIVGDIPQNDLQQLKDIFDNGVTFWHNPNTFLDYSQVNPHN